MPLESSGAQEKILSRLAGQVLMDREPGRIWVYERAETGRPLAACEVHGTRGNSGADRSRSRQARASCIRQRWNGPIGTAGLVGHKISALGLPPRKASATGCSVRFAAIACGSLHNIRHNGRSRAVPFAYPLAFRLIASSSGLAASSSRQLPLDGKVRWQKRFVSPARRMRRGLQF